MPNAELNKIMLVEDDQDISAIVKYALEKNGKWVVTNCSSGKEALKTVKTLSPDLILLDVMMPEMDGIQTFNEIRKIPVCQSIPIVFLTAKAQKEEIESYLMLGVTAVITKPVSVIKLLDDVRQIWEKNKSDVVSE